MKIGLDFDDVIVDSQLVKSILAKQMFGVEIPPQEFFKPLLANRLTIEQYEAVKKEVFSGQHDIPQIRDATHYLKVLIDQGYTIRIVSSRQGGKIKWAVQYLENKLGSVTQSIEFCGVGYKVSKTNYCHDLQVFVDDDVEKLVPLGQLSTQLIHFIGQHCGHQATPKGIIRVTDWYELYQYIRYELRRVS